MVILIWLLPYNGLSSTLVVGKDYDSFLSDSIKEYVNNNDGDVEGKHHE